MSKQSHLLARRHTSPSGAMPAAEDFFAKVAARLRSRMVNRSATDISIRTSGVEVRALGELFTDSEYCEGGIYGMLWVGNARIPGAILIQHALLSRLISVLLGQPLGETDLPTQYRTLSPVERRIASRLCTELLNEVVACWPESPAPRIQFGGLSTAVHPMEPAMMTVPVYSVTLDFGPEDSPLGLLNLALPQPALDSLSVAPVHKVEPEEPVEEGLNLDLVMPVEVELSVELAQIQLTVNRLRSLAVGDLIDLGILRDAVIKVNGLPMFEGQAGMSSQNRSVKILRRVIR